MMTTRNATGPTTTSADRQSFGVTGLTCGHCAAAVTTELSALDGVRQVDVALVPGGVSTVSVTTEHSLSPTDVVAALDEAGDYHLA